MSAAATAAPAAATLVPSMTTTPAAADTMRNKGMCPIKKEFLREAKIERISLDAEQKTRGMNKGSQREHVSIVGTERPTFEGEVNFLTGAVLTKVKEAIRQPKRGREKVEEAPPPPPPPPPAAPSSGFVGGELDGVALEAAPGANTAAAAAAASRSEEARAVNKDRAAAWQEYVGVPADERRERQAKSRALFKNRLILAPLTTVGNLPYRRICKEYGVDNTVSEMAMIYNLNKTQKSEWSLLRRHSSEDVFGLQVAVNRADDAAAFARAIAASDFSYDYIDINCGCPIALLCEKGCGCGLWEKKGKLRDVVKALTQFQSKPVTIKCRIGADETVPTLHKVIGEYEEWGACAVTIHGRSKQQRYTKYANWGYIDQCSYLTSLPVIGNGDVFSYQDILERREMAPHVDSYMIGRGALIKPWVFEEIKERKVFDISSHERFEMLKRFCSYGLAHWDSDERGVQTTRRFLCEWLSFLCRYVPVALLEVLPQRMNDRPPAFVGRDDLETLMASDSVQDWIRLSEMLLGPAGDTFKFTPKHKSNSYATVGSSEGGGANGGSSGGGAVTEDQG